MNALSALLDRHAQDEATTTCLPRLSVHRGHVTAESTSVNYPPVICMVAQGRKRVFVGDESFDYEPLTYLVSAAHLPVTAHVIEGPFLACSLLIDQEMLAAVIQEMPRLASPMTRAFGVTHLDGALLDSVLRFVRLLDEPQHAGVLGPLAERELLYRMLLGPCGAMLRQFAAPSSQLSQINRAIAVIRAQYDQPLHTAELARIASMSEASFHRHFKAATSMSPLQFQKQLRLQ